MLAKGDFNHLIVIMGVPETGKSTYAVKRAKEIQKAEKAYCLAHDPGWRLPRDPAIMRHESFKHARDGLIKRPGAIHAISVVNGQRVVEWAAQCATAAMKDEVGPPFLVILDDVTQVRGASRYRISDEMLESIVARRHRHVGLIITVQDPHFAHYGLLSQSTELVFFRLIDEKSIDSFARYGVPADVRARIGKLPDYVNIVHRTK